MSSPQNKRLNNCLDLAFHPTTNDNEALNAFSAARNIMKSQGRSFADLRISDPTPRIDTAALTRITALQHEILALKGSEARLQAALTAAREAARVQAVEVQASRGLRASFDELQGRYTLLVEEFTRLAAQMSTGTAVAPQEEPEAAQEGPQRPRAVNDDSMAKVGYSKPVAAGNAPKGGMCADWPQGVLDAILAELASPTRGDFVAVAAKVSAETGFPISKGTISNLLYRMRKRGMPVSVYKAAA